MNLDKYKGTLIKLINSNNMSEIQGVLLDVDNGYVTLEKAVIIVNRAVADMATTINEIIQYKYDNNSLGSTIASPLCPLFNNDDGKQIVYLNLYNWAFIPLYNKKDDINSSSNKKDDIMSGPALEEVMLRYIDTIYEQYKEMTDMLLTNEEVEKEILTNEDIENE